MIQKIIQTIQKNKSFIISSHVNPDPDALCSEIALALYLESLGKKVTVVNEEAVPQRYRFLPQVRLIKSLETVKRAQADVAIIVDCGDFERVGKVKDLMKKSLVINIDHHVTNNRFGHLNWVDEHASSTAEIIYRLLKKAKASLTYDQAFNIYTGIMTDTGSFCYDNTSRRTHQISGELLDFGFSANEIYRQVYETTPLRDMQLYSQTLSKFDLYCDKTIVFVDLSKKVMDQFSGEFDVREQIFKFFRAIKEIEAVVIFTEEGKNETKVNFRSKLKLNVAKVASLFDGGGHKRASGCTLKKTVKQARVLVLKEIKGVL